MNSKTSFPTTAFIGGGGGRGIGRAIALALAADGYEVFVVSRTTTELDNIRVQMRTGGASCHVRPTDLTLCWRKIN